MKPGFKFDVSKNANLKSVCAVKKLLKIVQGRTPIRHRIGVLILDTYVLDHSNKEAKALKAGKHAVFGLFVPKKSKKRFAQFWIPGCDCMIILPARLPFFDNPKKPAPIMLYWTLIHEMVHYMQFRDRKKLQEPGVEERTEKIMNELFATWNSFVVISGKTIPSVFYWKMERQWYPKLL